MKCSACANEECGGEYENRSKCVGRKEGVSCACKCRITKTADVITKGISAIGGGVAIGGGIFVAMVPPLRGFLIGVGSSLISKPFRKDLDGEHLEFDDSVSEALHFGAIGGSMGAGVGLVNEAKTAADVATAVVTLTGAAIAGAKTIKNQKILT